MSKYVLLTDSACDLPQKVADRHHIDIVCFKIALDGEGYTERVDFAPEDFAQMLREAKGLPTTSQVTRYEFLERFEAYAEAGVEEVLYVSINAAGSGTNAAAHAAAQDFHEEHPDSRMQIYIVDGRGYSLAYGGELVNAALMLEEGSPMQEVVSYLNDKYARMVTVITTYSLKVVRKSGRVNAAAAIAGDLLGIRPIFTLIDGESKVVKKLRGDKAVVSAMIKFVKEGMVAGTPYYLGYTNEKYVEEYAALAEREIGYAPEMIIPLGSAVCANIGPDAVGLVFEGPKRG
ncbi:MAG: DegV family protein [Clostridia bacterium]|nr:DegV family protein [Clostridia bacterium]